MIQFWFHEYEIVPIMPIGAIAPATPRKGALLRIEWPKGKVGYADLHPWPELGDAPLDVHIEALRKGRISTLTEQAMWLAKKDADARIDKRNLMVGSQKVKNHFLLNDFSKLSEPMIKEIKSAGFTTLKLKVGRDLDEELKFISKVIRQNGWLMVRLDFGAKTTFSQFERFMLQLPPPERAKVEFVEDPCSWDFHEWREASRYAPIAIDCEFDKVDWDKIQDPPFKILVIKPARQDIEQCQNLMVKFDLKGVVTSSLDHPVGVVHSAIVASHFKKLFPNQILECGCLSLRSYRPNEFYPKIQVQGPFLQGTLGSGIGFDDLFEGIEWTPLRA